MTQISASAPRENAGGEAGGEDAAGTTTEARPEASDDGASTGLVIVALALGAAGLAVGGAALVTARRRK